MVARMSASAALVQGLAPRRLRGARITRRQVMLAATVLLVLEVAGFAYFVAGTHGLIVPLHQPLSTDFVSFFAGGRLASDGTAALVYDHTAHYAAEEAATEPGVPYNYFDYPPVFLLVCAALARLPYLAAFAAFQMGTLVPCLLVARRILRERGWAVLVPFLAFPPVFFTLGTGQNAFLTAALFGAATLLVDRRPALAGILFGALCYKPHFGLLIPVALIAAGRWRTIASAAATVGGLVGLSAAVFGCDVWGAFLHAAAGARGVYEAGVVFQAMTTPFGATLALGGPVWLPCTLQAVSALVMAMAVFVTWRRGMSLPIRAALLLAATPLAVPVAMFYDLMLSGMALAWLVRWSKARRFPAWLRVGAVAAYIGSLLTGNFDPHSHLVVAPLVAAGVFAMAVGAAQDESRILGGGSGGQVTHDGVEVALTLEADARQLR